MKTLHVWYLVIIYALAAIGFFFLGDRFHSLLFIVGTVILIAATHFWELGDKQYED